MRSTMTTTPRSVRCVRSRYSFCGMKNFRERFERLQYARQCSRFDLVDQ